MKKKKNGGVAWRGVKEREGRNWWRLAYLSYQWRMWRKASSAKAKWRRNVAAYAGGSCGEEIARISGIAWQPASIIISVA